MAAPLYFPKAPAWYWKLSFWAGVTIMAVCAILIVILVFWLLMPKRPGTKSVPAIYVGVPLLVVIAFLGKLAEPSWIGADAASTATTVVGILNSWWTLAGLMIAALMLALWDWRLFWRARHRVIFYWRRTMEPEVWIDRASAIAIIEKSKWAISRYPGGSTTISSIIFGFNPALDQKFKRFCELVLDRFADVNGRYVRISEGKKEYLENKLRQFLQESYDDDVRKQFGEVPYKVV